MATGLFSTPKKDFDLDKNPDWFDGQLNQLSPIAVEPLISGYAFIKWLKTPNWVDGKNAPYPYFKQLTEKNLVSFKGNEDITLEDVKMTQGFSKTETSFAGGMGAITSTFSMSHNEYSGSPVSRAYSYWVSGVRDPRSNIATYPSFTHNTEPGKYGVKHHTGILLYVKTKPYFNVMGDKATDDAIEYASLYTNVMPTKIITSHQDFTAGTNDKAEPIDMEFLCKKVMGDLANKLALTYLKGAEGGVGDYLHMNDALENYINADGTLTF